MSAKLESGASGWVDPDDAPELSDTFFDRAEIRRGDELVRRGRPPTVRPKVQVTLRLDQEVIERYRATGAGWQSRINETLRTASPPLPAIASATPRGKNPRLKA